MNSSSFLTPHQCGESFIHHTKSYHPEPSLVRLLRQTESEAYSERSRRGPAFPSLILQRTSGSGLSCLSSTRRKYNGQPAGAEEPHPSSIWVSLLKPGIPRKRYCGVGTFAVSSAGGVAAIPSTVAGRADGSGPSSASASTSSI